MLYLTHQVVLNAAILNHSLCLIPRTVQQWGSNEDLHTFTYIGRIYCTYIVLLTVAPADTTRSPNESTSCLTRPNGIKLLWWATLGSVSTWRSTRLDPRDAGDAETREAAHWAPLSNQSIRWCLGRTLLAVRHSSKNTTWLLTVTCSPTRPEPSPTLEFYSLRHNWHRFI